jgi:puromycin-sensitive aminopeptidase
MTWWDSTGARMHASPLRVRPDLSHRSSYQVNGESRFMAVTQFEATDARRCFPCWDEPSHKAVFSVSLRHAAHLQSLANMPIVSESVDGAEKVVKFADSPIMSTYLLAFAVGEFEFIEGKTEEGVTVRCYTSPGKSQHCAFALEVATRSLSYYNKYFGIPYPLPKLDMLAIPDFAAGAMENWVGCLEVAVPCERAYIARGGGNRVS